MNSQNLLRSLNKRELSGILKLKKPLKSYSLSSLIGIDRFSDTFLGFSIGCDFIISLNFDPFQHDDFYGSSFKNVSINFNTSPIIGGEVNIFHQIHLGPFPNFGMYFHFYQNITNPDTFVVLMSEADTDFLIIIFGSMPQIMCSKCQNKCCKKHGVIARLSYQLAPFEKQHQVTTIYPQGGSLVVVLADCEGSIRLLTVNFPDDLKGPQTYPCSQFPLSIYLKGNTIIENDCDCFFDFGLPENLQCAKSRLPPTIDGVPCHKCLHDLRTLRTETPGHTELALPPLAAVHDPRDSRRSILLPGRAATVTTCEPVSKRTFLGDIGASYQSLVLARGEGEAGGAWTYDEVHPAEIIGAAEAGDRGYHWRAVESEVKAVAVAVVEELVFTRLSSWAGGQDQTVHCLGLATGTLGRRLCLLVHLEAPARLLEVDLDTGGLLPVPLTAAGIPACAVVAMAARRDRPLLTDLNNDLQVSSGRSLEALTDHSGLFELRH